MSRRRRTLFVTALAAPNLAVAALNQFDVPLSVALPCFLVLWAAGFTALRRMTEMSRAQTVSPHWRLTPRRWRFGPENWVFGFPDGTTFRGRTSRSSHDRR
ncbi:hypothetical protein [Actinopolyspora mortivallis]|uniref:Uncharacterized protein n=1 Tax=Actinopolyspora mortivallis TaxID=33906 RepID=A0A2T0H0H7_ACTMO|nr:hypothetical protein [Actinopolyspora mortivallis]PRW64868.1 hypothetical protein CEP50_03375 [Actinopolyspora mortivallis]